jgi:hypothetical protein
MAPRRRILSLYIYSRNNNGNPEISGTTAATHFLSFSLFILLIIMETLRFLSLWRRRILSLSIYSLNNNGNPEVSGTTAATHFLSLSRPPCLSFYSLNDKGNPEVSGATALHPLPLFLFF